MRSIGVLVPTYNGGALLRQTVSSVARAGLDPREYSILIVDNASTDGSVEDLPSFDDAGAPIIVHRNEKNIGRVQNWNRAVKLASERFTHVIFLFVGDCFRPAASLKALVEGMDKLGADFGMAPFRIVDSEGRFQRDGRRMELPKAMMSLNKSDFLTQTIQQGALPFGPLQGNIYRIKSPDDLVFDPGDPTHTDQAATASFIKRCCARVLIACEPFVEWRAHANRFHMGMDLDARLKSDLRLLHELATEVSDEPHWDKVHAALLLRYSYHARRDAKILNAIRRRLIAEPGGVHWMHAGRLALQFASRRRPLIRYTETAA